MEIEIKSKINPELTLSFFMRCEGGYVYRQLPNRKGTLGVQLCKPSGATVRATPETFEAVCKQYAAIISI